MLSDKVMFKVQLPDDCIKRETWCSNLERIQVCLYVIDHLMKDQ